MKLLVRSYFLFLILLSCNAFAQQATISQTIRGKVLDKQTQSPLDGALVVVMHDANQLSAYSDAKGEFTIEKVPVGRHRFLCKLLGYNDYSIVNLYVYSGKENVLNVEMEENMTQLAEVVVMSKENKEQAGNQMALVSSRLLSAEEANRYAGSWGDPARMAANMAGVSAANDSRNDIIIRGNSPMGLLWRLDGFDISNPNHFGAMGGTGGPISMLNNNQLGNSDFYTGAFPAEFGNVTSGVFDLRLRNGNNKKREFLAGMGFNGFEGGAEGYFSKKSEASYMVNARYSFLKILDLMGMNFAGANGAVPEYQDLSVKINVPLKNGNFSFISLLGASRIHIKPDMNDTKEFMEGDFREDVQMRNKQCFFGANYTHRFSKQTRLENRLSYQFFDTNADVDELAFQFAERRPFFRGADAEGRMAWTSSIYHRTSVRNFFNAGMGVDYYMTSLDNTIYNNNVPRKLHDADKQSGLYKIYAQWQHRFNDKLMLIPGVHANHYSMTGETSVEPRLAFRWKLSPKFSINTGTGMYSQLQPRQVYFYRENNNEPNSKLKMTHSFQNVLGFDWGLSEGLRLKFESYYQHLYKVPVIPQIPQQSILNFGDDFHNSWDYHFVNKGTGDNYGLDVTLEKFFDKNYYFLVTASLYQSKYKGLDKVERNSKFNGNFALNTLGGYEWKIGERTLLSVNTKISWFGNKRFIPATTTSNMGLQLDYDYSQTYTQRYADYFKMDLNFNMKQNYNRFALEWFFEMGNITNHKNIWMTYYNSNQKKEMYIYQNGLMPIGGCKVYF